MGFEDQYKDHLKDLSPGEVAAWYSRLADYVEKKNSKVKNALAPQFLRHYLKGGGKKLIFEAPEHLKQSEYVVDVLKEHRAWYLTEKRFKGKWVGIIPRLQNNPPAWAKDPLWFPHDLKLNSLVEIEVKWFTEHTPGDNDLMTALHGFQLYTWAIFFFEKAPGKNNLKVNFTFFGARVDDKYDFDESEFFPVPNPDYGNPLKLAKPVASASERILVYHRNAKRMEKAGLAAPYDVSSYLWVEQSLMSPAEVDPAKNLAAPWP